MRGPDCSKGLRIIGQPVIPVDGLEKVTGTAKFAVDVSLPGMLWGKILRSPIPHAKILHVDVSEALRVKGVRAVVTAADTGKLYFGNLIKDQHVLAFDKVRYVGDEVAAVAAESIDVAEEALSLINVDYEPLPAVFDPEEAMRPGAPLVHEAERNVAHEVHFERGDVAGAYSRCKVVIEENFETSRVHQAYLEHQACVANIDERGRLEIWCATQTPGRARFLLAQALGIPVEEIRIHQTFVGGAFGGKSYQQILCLAAVLARKACRPVKVVYTREEDFACTLPRVPMRVWLRMGADADGRLLAKETRIVADNGAYSVNAPAVLDTAATRVDSLYRIPAVRTDAYLVYTNTEPTGMFRGFGNPQSTFAVESVMDMLAERLGMDPVEIRLRNATQPGDTTVHGWKVKSCGLSDCIKAVAQEMRTRQADLDGSRGTGSGKPTYRGVGMACVVHVNGNRSVFRAFEGSNAMVKLDEGGTATVTCSCGDIGQGASTLFGQIVAEVLSLPMEKVRVQRVDTDNADFGLGAYASRVTVIAGNAVKAAAEDLRKQLMEFASARWGLPSDQLEFCGGRLRPKVNFQQHAGDGEQQGHVCCFPAESVADFPADGIPLSEVVWEFMSLRGGLRPTGRGWFAPDDVVVADRKTKYGNISPTYTFGVQGVEVEVDPETGRITCTRVVAAYDAGRVVNPLLAEGQLEGGIVQGLGFALTERMVLKEGRLLNPTFCDYKMPTVRDVPPIKTIFVETHDPVGPFGAKGVGEPALVPTIAAVANAVYDATGVRLKRVPFTPEDLLHSLRRTD